MKRECYLCGEIKNLTRDHLPPKGIFRPPLPTNLITVPCCKKCNESFTLDDEVFIIFTAGHHAASADGIWVCNNKVSNSFRRSPKLLNKFRKSMVKVSVYEDNILSHRNGMTIEDVRVERVLQRMTKGFIFKFYPNIPHNDLNYKVDMINLDKELVENLNRRMRYDERGNGIFRFWRAVAFDEPTSGIWVYVFYDGVCFSVEHNKNKS